MSHSHETVVFAGSLAQRPGFGGHSWALLQYVLGFRRLGWDVLLLDWLDPDMCFDSEGRPCPLRESVNLKYFLSLMERFDLKESYALGFGGEGWSVGVEREQVLERVRSARFLLNVMGFLREEEVLASAQRRVFLDIDPGFGQMWFELGLADPFEGHGDFVTIAENMGSPGCRIPDCGRDWIVTRQPVVLEHWPASESSGGSFTSIASWRGLFGPVEFEGRSYGLRVHEFRKFVTLPGLTGMPFEIALDIHPDERADLSTLGLEKWRLVDPETVAGDPWSYQSYIRGSRAEFMVAKNMYVDTRSGWFSDRSICYLASGRPVLAQDTGLDAHYPSGDGLVLFQTLEGAVEGVERIALDGRHHSRSARQIAVEYFDSDKVLRQLTERLN